MGILNMHSLLCNQFQAPVYNDMLRITWRITDLGFSNEELTLGNRKAALTKAIQFDFRGDLRCQEANCTNYAFVRCAHCNKLLCSSHFLNRTCFHDEPDALDMLDLTENPFESEGLQFDDELFFDFSPIPNPTASTASMSISTTDSPANSHQTDRDDRLIAPFRLSEDHFEYHGKLA